MLTIGLVLLGLGLLYRLGERLGLPRVTYREDEQRRVLVRRMTPILLGGGLIFTVLGVMEHFHWISFPS